MSLEKNLSPKTLKKKNSPAEILMKRSQLMPAHPGQISHLQKFETINTTFKFLSLWQFIMQPYETNTVLSSSSSWENV